ncbi:MAG: type VI secretion system protein TssA [Gammaproteobacteria bacterium]|nr:MAG: type VI secretion system protein TssA [Pseudomonadota bacterium]PIE37968.1 MAG: type VI secretion system protein TssA [Gammaproteobacteria bacterium]
MATAEVFDIEDIVTPVSEQTPCGHDLREAGAAEYQQLKDDRRTIASLSRARKFDSQSDPEIDRKWKEIFTLAPSVLKLQAKDIEVAAWLAESALRQYGFAGLRDGFRLIRRLVEEFWDELYPLPDEDGLETRVFPIVGLNGEDGRGTLIQPIRSVPLSDHDSDAFTFNVYDRCIEASKMTDPDAQKQRLEDIGTDLSQLLNQVAEGQVAFFRNLVDDLEECLAEFNRMSSLFDEKCGYRFSPPSSAIKKTLEEVLDAVRFLTKDKFPAETGADDAGANKQPDPDSAGQDRSASAGHQVAIGAIGSRDDAINQLLLIADYFKKTEPHSPLCGAIERVAMWGKMSVQELMLQLIPDDNARAVYAQLTGIPLGDDVPPIGGLASTAVPVTPAVAPPEEEKPVARAEPVVDEWGAGPDISEGW